MLQLQWSLCNITLAATHLLPEGWLLRTMIFFGLRLPHPFWFHACILNAAYFHSKMQLELRCTRSHACNIILSSKSGKEMCVQYVYWRQHAQQLQLNETREECPWHDVWHGTNAKPRMATKAILNDGAWNQETFELNLKLQLRTFTS